MMKDIQCLRCGTLLLGGGCIQELCEKIAVKDDFSLAEFIVGCPKCSAQFGIVVASDGVGLMVLYVSPGKARQCFNELKQLTKTTVQRGLIDCSDFADSQQCKKTTVHKFLVGDMPAGSWRAWR